MKIKTFNYLWKIVVFPFALIKTVIMRVVNAVKKIDMSIVFYIIIILSVIMMAIEGLGKIFEFLFYQ